jgi:hypothetical protein
MEFIGESLQGIHVSALAVEVNGKQGAEFVAFGLAEKALYLNGIKVESQRVNIDENRASFGPDDRTRRGKEAKRRSENLIAGLNPGRSQRQPEGVGA